MMMKKILILTDSLSLPRAKPETLELQDTWPSVLESNFPDRFIRVAIGGATLTELFKQATGYYKSIEPDILIVQSGIVDCVPRGYSKLELQLIRKTSIGRHLFFKMIGTDRMRKFRKVNYTPVELFRKTAGQLYDHFINTRIIWVGIAPATIDYERQLPGITQSIRKYNEVLKNMQAEGKIEFIDTAFMPQSGLMSDHHHLNREGHAWVAEQLKDLLQNEKEAT